MTSPGEQTTIADFSDSDSPARNREDTLGAVVALLDRQVELFERVVDANDAATSAEPPGGDRTDVARDEPDYVSRGFW